MKTYKILDYKIEAESLTKACEVLSNLGLLKGHRLQLINGSTVNIEYIFYKKEEGYFCEKFPSINGRVIFFISENYHSPQRYKLFRSNDGTYISIFETRTGKISRRYGLNLAEAFAEAKSMCRSFNKEFEGFFPLEKDWMKDSIYKGIYFGKLSLFY